MIKIQNTDQERKSLFGLQVSEESESMVAKVTATDRGTMERGQGLTSSAASKKQRANKENGEASDSQILASGHTSFSKTTPLMSPQNTSNCKPRAEFI